MIICIFPFFFLCKVPPTRLDDEGIGVLVLSCFSNDARFMYDFFASLFHRQLRWGGTLFFHFLRTHSRCCCSCCVEKARLKLIWACCIALVWVRSIFVRCLFPDLFYWWLWYPFIYNNSPDSYLGILIYPITSPWIPRSISSHCSYFQVLWRRSIANSLRTRCVICVIETFMLGGWTCYMSLFNVGNLSSVLLHNAEFTD